MVTRIFLLLSLAVAAVALGCSSDSRQSTSSPAARPIATTVQRSGPRAVIEPASGPPGTRVTVTGTGWEPNSTIDLLGRVVRGETPPNYGTVTADAAGGFVFSFRLEKDADGKTLPAGRFDLIVRSASNEVDVPFQVESRRPIGGGGPGS